MFFIRQSFREDIDQIFEVAKYLDTVNLPANRTHIERILDLSAHSFAGSIEPFERAYLFVLVDAERQRIVGTSMIQAQHGTRRAPHVFFEVLEDERYSETLDRYFVHQCLRIGYNYDGPTEIGGLILVPEYRGRPEALGKLLSYTRFLFIAMHRPWFRDEILSELLPPLEADGTSLLWESLGRLFTGLTYQEADLLSKDNKEFIRALFPHSLLYTNLLPKTVQAIIGQVGEETRGVEKMLRRIGFRYAHRIDPFDGGPHYTASTDQITLLQHARRVRVRAVDGTDGGRPWSIIATEQPEPPRFRATAARFRPSEDGREIGITPATCALVGAQPGDEVWMVEA